MAYLKFITQVTHVLVESVEHGTVTVEVGINNVCPCRSQFLCQPAQLDTNPALRRWTLHTCKLSRHGLITWKLQSCWSRQISTNKPRARR